MPREPITPEYWECYEAQYWEEINFINDEWEEEDNAA